jgi:hypothetical protein
MMHKLTYKAQLSQNRQLTGAATILPLPVCWGPWIIAVRLLVMTDSCVSKYLLRAELLLGDDRNW